MSTYTLSSAITTGITLTSPGPDKSPFTITSTGSINDSSAPESYGALTGVVLATVTNAGHVTANRYGIYLRDGGLLTNTGSIYAASNGVKGEHITAINGIDNFDYNSNTTTLVNSGYVGASGYAVQFNYGGAVTNNGTIKGGSSGTGVAIHTLAGNVINTGNISGDVDVQLANGGYLSNSSTGVLLTTNPNYGDGVELGSGNATVVNAGHITAGYAGIYDRYASNIDIRNSGVILGGTVASNYSAGIWIDSVTGGVTVQNSGLIESGQGASGNAIYVTSAALNLIVDPGASFVGSVSAYAGATNSIELGSGASAGTITGLGSQFTNFKDIAIDTGATWTISGNATGLTNHEAITGLTGRDTIDLTGVAATSDSFASGVLTLFSAGNVELGTLDLGFADFLAGSTISVQSDGHGGTDIVNNAPCFLAGTYIATPHGDVPVESLKMGDLVLTAAGEAVPVRWMGIHTAVTRFANRLRVMPVRIKAGALGADQAGENLPQRDLLVSPDHAMFIGGALIQAGALVNGSSITRETTMPERFTYYHVEVANHALILAEGAVTETFVDHVDRMNFDNWAEYEALYGHETRVRELPYPRVKSARQIPLALRHFLGARAIALGGIARAG